MNLKELWMRKRRRRYTAATTNAKRKGGTAGKMSRLVKDAKKRTWRIPKFRVKMLSSPLKQWKKLKNAMVNFAGRVGGSGSTGKAERIGEEEGDSESERVELLANDKEEYENRVLYEIYKSLVASIELNAKYRQSMCV